MYINLYLDKYKDTPFKKEPFNEIDALIFTSLSYPHYEDFMGKKKKANGLLSSPIPISTRNSPLKPLSWAILTAKPIKRP